MNHLLFQTVCALFCDDPWEPYNRVCGPWAGIARMVLLHQWAVRRQFIDA